MCGIGGYLGIHNKDIIKQMSRDMQHRGPDGEGIYSDQDVTLLNRRLAIIDRKGGDQPIYNEDKSLVVVYNGEIYNYRELREELEQKGHIFKTRSDTEVIVHGYEEWGDTAFEKYNGMFGIALYDMKKKRLLLARDHFGIKPLYYASLGSQILFASEIKPLINSGLIEKKPDDRVVYRYLQYRIHDEGRQTFFHGVERLLPGEMMIITKKGIEKKMFSTLQNDILKEKNKDSSLNKKTHEFKDHLIHAIKLRLISEVPVGTCLSGGLDSSTVVKVVNDLLKENVSEAQSIGKKQNTFSAVFPDSINDEERYIDDLLNTLHQVKSIKVHPKPEDFFAEIEDFVRTQEEPTISTGPYAQFQVMREAKKHVTVTLDGQGADEIMAGYYPYYFVYWKQLYKNGEIGKLVSELVSSLDIVKRFALQKIKQYLGFDTPISVNSLLKEKFIKAHKKEKFITTSDNLKKRLKEDIFENSLQALLRYEDKNAMRFSLEGRVPFLDFNLVRFLFSLPDEAIINKGWNKYILRKAVKEMLPESIHARRNKIGFTTPEEEWFMRMKNRIYGIFLSEEFSNRPYFKQADVLKAFEQFIAGKNTDTLLFWRILNIELWMREFFDAPSSKQTAQHKKEKGYFDPNTDKNIEINVKGTRCSRFPIKTALFQKGDEYAHKIAQEIQAFFKHITPAALSQYSVLSSLQKQKAEWCVIVSEKIVAISQGRAYFIWDIKVGFWAKLLQKYVRRTPYGIGLGSPWTMQLAIEEVGLPRILCATILSALTKPFGVRGLFYRIAGREASSIDGPTEYSLYPSNVSAKLMPKDPQKAAQKIKNAILSMLPEKQKKYFKGAVIIDANDIGRTVLGNATEYDDATIEKIMQDNPMGQGSEQTPVVVCVGGGNSP